jgi:hypothetical protein
MGKGRCLRKSEKRLPGEKPLISERSRVFLDLPALQKKVRIAPPDFPRLMKRGGKSHEDHSVGYSATAIPGAVQRV